MCQTFIVGVLAARLAGIIVSFLAAPFRRATSLVVLGLISPVDLDHAHYGRERVYIDQ